MLHRQAKLLIRKADEMHRCQGFEYLLQSRLLNTPRALLPVLLCTSCALPFSSDSQTKNKAAELSATVFVDSGEDSLWEIEEGQLLDLSLTTSATDAETIGLSVSGLPPGASYNESSRRLLFKPDFIQGGGDDWEVVVRSQARLDGEEEPQVTEQTLSIRVLDTIQPPEPRVLGDADRGDHRVLRVGQLPDSFLDGYAFIGRSFGANVVLPSDLGEEERIPVRIELHGFGASPRDAYSARQFHIYPHDPDQSYWWGYQFRGVVPNYAQRRILNLLAWVLKTYPQADPERVYLAGGSMGAAGAKVLGLLSARHFCYVSAFRGQSIPRLHIPNRIAQLSRLWGDVENSNLPVATSVGEEGNSDLGIWDRQDLTAMLMTTIVAEEEGTGSSNPYFVREARDQFIFARHGKQDQIIPFEGAALGFVDGNAGIARKTGITGKGLYRSLQDERTGHYVAWDQATHTTSDPDLGDRWWDRGFSLIFDAQTYLRRNLAFPAFSDASIDWNAESDPAGALNRFLRWDASQIVDESDAFAVPIRYVNEPSRGETPPRAGYPSIGDLFDRSTPVIASMSHRVERKTFEQRRAKKSVGFMENSKVKFLRMMRVLSRFPCWKSQKGGKRFALKG